MLQDPTRTHRLAKTFPQLPSSNHSSAKKATLPGVKWKSNDAPTLTITSCCCERNCCRFALCQQGRTCLRYSRSGRGRQAGRQFLRHWKTRSRPDTCTGRWRRERSPNRPRFALLPGSTDEHQRVTPLRHLILEEASKLAQASRCRG